MTDKYEIQNYVGDLFEFENFEIYEIIYAYNLPSWPKFSKRLKLETLNRVFTDKLRCLSHFGCTQTDINSLSELLINKCLLSCDVASYAQKIPLIGRMITVGKFPVVMKAMKAATVEYVYCRSNRGTAEEALYVAKHTYWRSIIEFLDTWVF